MEQFRAESGLVYEYSILHKAYLFCGKLNGRTLQEFIADYLEIDLD